MNICYYHQDLHWRQFHLGSPLGFSTTSTPVLLLVRAYNSPGASPGRCRRDGGVSVTRFSAIHFRGRSIRQVSCYTLLSGCRLPWPPSCCLNESTPFVGSSEHAFWHLNPCVWFIPHRHSCLPGLAHLRLAPLRQQVQLRNLPPLHPFKV